MYIDGGGGCFRFCVQNKGQHREKQTDRRQRRFRGRRGLCVCATYLLLLARLGNYSFSNLVGNNKQGTIFFSMLGASFATHVLFVCYPRHRVYGDECQPCAYARVICHIFLVARTTRDQDQHRQYLVQMSNHPIMHPAPPPPSHPLGNRTLRGARLPPSPHPPQSGRASTDERGPLPAPHPNHPRWRRRRRCRRPI